MTFLGACILFVSVLPVPLGAGAGIASFVEKEKRNPAFMWMAGYMLLFSVFQVTAVPMILAGMSLTALAAVFRALSAALCLAGAACWMVRVCKGTGLRAPAKPDRAEWILWGVFGAVLLFQMVMAVVLAFGDGDDAYYVSVSVIADRLDSLYRQLPYTGSVTGLDFRHCLAPFSLYAAYLARISGVHAATVSHVVMPVFLLPLVYGIYGQLGYKLLKKRKSTALFLLFAELLVLWGNYSPYSAETFLMIRIWQGKAVLANAVIPCLLLMLCTVGEHLAEKQRIGAAIWITMGLSVTAACLCSTQGGVLAATLLAVGGFCLAAAYRSLKPFFCCALCAFPALVFSGLYIMMR